MNWSPPFVFLLALAAATGCGEPDDEFEPVNEETGESDVESNIDEDTGEFEKENESDGCEEVSLDIKGPTSPKVGDEWFVIMRCDNAVLQGPTVIRFSPPDFANLDGKTIIFTTSGHAGMRVQVGTYRVDTDIVVRP